MSNNSKKNNVRSNADLTKDLLNEEFVSDLQKKHDLQTAIFQLSKTHPFLGSVMQCMNISYTHILPTAGVSFNNDLKRWDLSINPFFFCKKLSPDNRKAVLLHEIYHIIHKHPFRVPFTTMGAQKRDLMNRAMDMAINQYISDLPKGCKECSPSVTNGMKFYECENENCPGSAIFVEDFSDIDSKGNTVKWEKLKAFEFYYEKLLSKLNDSNKEEEDKTKQGEGSADGVGTSQGTGSGLPGGTIDIHNWDDSSDEKDVLDATEDLMKRAMIKQGLSYTDLPAAIKDLLSHIDTRRAELNYKAIILMAMKSSLPSNVRKHSWTRKSRRFGNKAPGNKNASQPKLEIFIDTSGSISVEEANEFLNIVDEFLKVGARQCHLNMFHTSNYYSKKYAVGLRPKADEFQSGGTCLKESLTLICKKKPDLSIFLTDGCYSDVDVESMVGIGGKVPRTVFIISKDGSERHPFAKRDWARTVKIPGNKG